MKAIHFVYFLMILTLFLTFSDCNKMMQKNLIKDSPIPIKNLQSMNEIMPYVSLSDLVIFDIDHTLLQAKSLYCHSNWFYDHYEEALALGFDEKHVINVLAPIWEMSQKLCEVKAVEPFIPTLIKEIQQSEKKVMALTSRSENIMHETIDQLSSLGIDFSSSAPNKENFVMPMARNVNIKNGIIFTSDYLTKGEVLREYLKQTGYQPKNIVFIDDGMRNLTSVFHDLGEIGINVNCFLYPLVKRSPDHWDKKRADLEWEKRHGKLIY